MSNEIVPYKPHELARPGQPEALAIIQAGGGDARFAYEDFFSGIGSPHAERAYRNAVHRLLAWCNDRGLALNQVRPPRSLHHPRSSRRPLARPGFVLAPSWTF